MRAGNHRMAWQWQRPHLPERAGAILVAAGLVLLAVVWSSGPSRASADDRDQITGAGTAESAVTVKWSDGLLGQDNKTVVAPRSQGQLNPDFYAGTFNQFKNIQVTVSQTQNLVHQAIAVTWTGAPPTLPQDSADYFQIMQCYGDAETGPLPDNCEYGANGLLLGSGPNQNVGSRAGTICPGGQVTLGCDPLETSPDHVLPGSGGSSYYDPFTPVGTSTKIYNTADSGLLTDYYDKFTSNEVQQATTAADGTGQQYFQALPSTQAAGLGCGAPDTDTGTSRDCWLVIVPRGDYRPSGFKIDPNGGGADPYVTDSPLGASNWAQRIQVHLNFAPIQQSCPIGSAKERQTVGTQLVSNAVFSWQLALNKQANCTKLYGFTATPEATQTSQLDTGTAGGAAGLAFTTIPIGSEAGREAGVDTPSPVGVTYAPVAVAALTLGFQINLASGYVTQPIKLTPRLVAKALTQSYQLDLPQYTPENPVTGPIPDWAINNPTSIIRDPEFQALNPNVPNSSGSGSPLAPLIGQDHSALNEQLWQWILSDAKARAWLDGAPDEHNMVVNPAYGTLKLGDAAIDSFPRAEPACHDTGQGGVTNASIRCSLDLLPYMQSFDDAAVHIRASNNPEGANWDPTKTAPDGSNGWWNNGSIEPAGRVFLWGLIDTPEAATYGLISAALCDGNGANCVTANDQTVAAALGSATADSSGLLAVNPSAPGAGAYPLVDVTYAAVRTDDDPAAVTDYADLIDYAVGPGQTPGEAPGELPRGYLPLPANLKAIAQAAVTSLRAGPATSTTSAPAGSNADANNLGGSTTNNGSMNLGRSANEPGSSDGVAATAAGQPAIATSAGPDAVIKPTSTPVVYATQAQSAPAARYAAFGVILAGIGGLVGSPALRYLGRRRAIGARR